jgi:glycosyltransferase involved in cell wall biosynthesis
VYQTAGSQQTVQDLRAHAEALGLANRVGFTGHVEDVPSAIRALDIVVHASTEPEPFGMVVIEAMACAKPVVVSLAGGIAEIVEAGRNALVHAPGDVEGLAAQIGRLIGDPALRSRLGGQARLDAERRFDRARLADALVPLYESLART